MDTTIIHGVGTIKIVGIQTNVGSRIIGTFRAVLILEDSLILLVIIVGGVTQLQCLDLVTHIAHHVMEEDVEVAKVAMLLIKNG